MKNFLKKVIVDKARGFTILETLIAIFILTLSITGPMVFAQQGLRAAFLARDQITAFYLAQDVIEVVKNSRDENSLKNRDWMDGIDICTGTPNAPCAIYIDTTVDTTVDPPLFKKCSIGGVCPIMQLDENGRFIYDDLKEDSRFTRTTYIEQVAGNVDSDGNPVEARIVVEVEWTSNVRVGNARVLVQENIYNWIPVAQ